MFLFGFASAGCLWRMHARTIGASQRRTLEAVRDGKVIIDVQGAIGWIIR